MTPEQFKEYKKLIEEMNYRLKTIGDITLNLFNVTNKMSDFLGAEQKNGILEKILTELEKN